MNARRRTLLLAAALSTTALSSVARAFTFAEPVIATPTCTQDNFRALETVLPSILTRSLYASRNSEGIPTARFLGGHRDLTFRIAVDDSQRGAFGGRPGISPTTIMAYSDYPQEIEIHHALLHLDGSDERKILADPARLEKTARRFLPVVVHEVSHARTRHGASRFVASVVLEDEYIAFYREVFFLLEQLESEPDYLGVGALAACGRDATDDQIVLQSLMPRASELTARRHRSPEDQREFAGLRARIEGLAAREKARTERCPASASLELNYVVLLSLFARSPGDFERYIDTLYARKHLLRLDAPDLIARANDADEEGLRAASRLRARLDRLQVPRSSPDYAVVADGEETLRLEIDDREKARAFWNDPARARRAVAAYKAELADIRARAAEKRERHKLVLKPFLPEAPASGPASRATPSQPP